MTEPDLQESTFTKKLSRATGRLRAKWALRTGILEPAVCVCGSLEVLNHGVLRVGRGVTFLGGMIPTKMILQSGTVMIVGEKSLFNYGSIIDVKGSLVIGKRCMVASMVKINCTRGGIVLGDDVWVAHGAVIGPGVTIGDGSVVAAGSVVVRDVPPQSLAVGNPARSMPLRIMERRSAPIAHSKAPINHNKMETA